MGNVTFKNFNINKLNKTLKQLNRNGVLVGPRATEGSYGDLANQLQASVDRGEEKKKKRKSGRRAEPKQRESGKRGIGIAVKGGGRIL